MWGCVKAIHIYLLNLQGWLSKQLHSPRSCSFGVLSWALIFFRGTVVFANSYLKHQVFVKTKYFFKSHLQSSIIWSSVSFYLKRGVATRHSFFQTYWYLFLSKKERQSSILWRVLYLLWRENLQPSIVLVILSAVVCLLPKKVGSSYAFFQRYYNYFYRTLTLIHSFNSTVHFSDVKINNHLILRTYFLSVYFRTPVTVKQTSYRIRSFLEQHPLNWNESNHFKQLLFRWKFFYRKLVVRNSYFFLILRLGNKYFFWSLAS